MKKIFSLTLLATLFAVASYAQLGPIIGSSGCCTGSTGYVTDSTHPGGTWSSLNTAVATIDASGNVFGVAPGLTILTYTLGGSYITDSFTVYAAPTAIAGATYLCSGSSVALSDGTPGGIWSSGNPYVATISPSGVLYGVHSGVVDVYYNVGGSCYAMIMDTVNASYTPLISGPVTVCASGTATLTDSAGATGGIWSSSNTAIATVSAGGVVYGVTVGTVTITYTLSSACGPVYDTHTMSVINTTSAPVIPGTSTLAVGSPLALYASPTGGTWGSTTPSVATITSSGVVYGVAAGTAYITYTISGCGGTRNSIDTVTVTPFDGVSGYVHFGSGAYYGGVKIWLITYDAATSDLEAYDSSLVYSSDTMVYYQFAGVPANSYRVKAARVDSIGGSPYSYIPTYHNSSFYWNTANIVAHTSGTADINENIDMMTGTATSGPGFIGGNVTTGANKGTAGGGIPVVGMSMNLLNSSTNQLMQSVRTDASGHYSFSNLPVGATYYVFPDSLNFMTTPFTGISLTASSPSASGADFIQHTISMTITPGTTGVTTLQNIASSIVAFPNPANNKLNLQWNVVNAENGSINITDVTGREVYQSALTLTKGAGLKQIDMTGLVNGLYIITVKSGTLNYNTKIQVQH